MNLNRRQISKIIKKFQKYDDIVMHYENSGRKSKLTPVTKQLIESSLASNPSIKLKEIKAALEEEGKILSKSTINR